MELYVYSTILFFLIFSFVVLIHELGHFLSARRHGVFVEEFGLGLPPKWKTLFTDSKQCEFSLNMIPFGGFVRLQGENGEEEEEGGKKKDPKKSFDTKSWRAKTEILLAGVFMNALSALVFLTGVFMYGSEPLLLTSQNVETMIEKGVIEVAEGIEVLDISPGGKAEEAGVQKGDVLLSINNIPVKKGNEVSELQKEAGEYGYHFQRENTETLVKEDIFLNITPDNGKIGASFSLFPEFTTIHTLKLSFIDSLWYSISFIQEFMRETLRALSSLFLQMFTDFSLPEGVAGPLGIASMTHSLVVSGASLDAILKFVSILSLSLAIMNILPLPVLDGGRVFIITLQSIFKKKYQKIENISYMVSYALLFFLIFVITYKDIVRLFS
jgi:regulator of sigma E protease